MSGHKILIVEDNLLNMELFMEILELKGYEVHPFYNAEEALEKMKPINPNLILLDIALPGLDGLSALRILKADPETAEIPVVVVSAHSLLTDERAAREAGCSEYLTKPISGSALLITVSEFIGTP